MARGFFITGTDTGVGKTFIGAALARVLKKKFTVGVMKPVETGCAERDGRLVPEDATRLMEAASSEEPLDIINPYRFRPPVAPSVAAEAEGVRIDLERIKDAYGKISAKNEITIVEGAGGLMTPVSEWETMADVARLLEIPVIVVVASRLGAINQALLTIHTARSLGLDVAGFVMNIPSSPPGSADESRATNAREIERMGRIKLLAEIPRAEKAPQAKEVPQTEKASQTEKAPYRSVRGLAERLLEYTGR